MKNLRQKPLYGIKEIARLVYSIKSFDGLNLLSELILEDKPRYSLNTLNDIKSMMSKKLEELQVCAVPCACFDYLRGMKS